MNASNHRFREQKTDELAGILGCEHKDVPAVFANPEVIYPLKVGTFEDLIGRYPTLNRSKLRYWLRSWTYRGAYLRAVQTGAQRFDLDLNPAGEIDDASRTHAGFRLADKAAAKAKQAARQGRPIDPPASTPESAPPVPDPIPHEGAR